MSSTVWTTETPQYPGYYWAISKHGDIDLVRVRSIVHDFPSTANLVVSKFNYTFGDMCAADTLRWTHWTPTVAPERPATLPKLPVKKDEHEEKHRGIFADLVREQIKKAPVEARFQKLVAGEGETVSDAVGVGENMLVIDGVAVVPGMVLEVSGKDEKVSDRETGWNLVHKDLLEKLGRVAHGREDIGVMHLTEIARDLAAKISTMSAAGREGAYRRLRAVNPTVLCMVKSFVTPAKEKEDNSLPRP